MFCRIKPGAERLGFALDGIVVVTFVVEATKHHKALFAFCWFMAHCVMPASIPAPQSRDFA